MGPLRPSSATPISASSPKDDKALELIRHDAAHVLAMAVQALYPGTRTIGPRSRTLLLRSRRDAFTPGRFAQIEQDADREGRSADAPRSVAARQSIAHSNHRRDYKAELIAAIPRRRCSIYWHGTA